MRRLIFLPLALLLFAACDTPYQPTVQCEAGYTSYTQTDTVGQSSPIIVCFKPSDGKPAVYK